MKLKRTIHHWPSILVILIASLLSLLACQDVKSPVFPSGMPLPEPVIGDPVPPTNTTPNPTLPDVGGDCDVVNLNRGGIKNSLDGLVLSLFVPATSTFGLNPYVDVWTPELNHSKLGTGQANEWFMVTLPSYGTHTIRLAVEVSPDGKVYQCDRHKFTVTATPPPTTPECQPEFTEREEVLADEWGACQPTVGAWGAGIKSRIVTTQLFTTNSCTEEEELTSTTQQQETTECYVPCVEPEFVLPEEGTYPKQGNEFAECSFFDMDVVEKENNFPWDLEDGDIYLCKAGTELYLWHDKPSRYTFKCPNRKLVSHMTVCERRLVCDQ